MATGCPGVQLHRSAKKRVECADIGMHFGEMPRAVFFEGNFVIPIAGEQLVNQIGNGPQR